MWMRRPHRRRMSNWTRDREPVDEPGRGRAAHWRRALPSRRSGWAMRPGRGPRTQRRGSAGAPRLARGSRSRLHRRGGDAVVASPSTPRTRQIVAEPSRSLCRTLGDEACAEPAEAVHVEGKLDRSRRGRRQLTLERPTCQARVVGLTGSLASPLDHDRVRASRRRGPRRRGARRRTGRAVASRPRRSKARLSSASLRMHSSSSTAPRSGQTGSPTPRKPRPAATFASTNSRQTGMIRAGLRPIRAISMNVTPSAPPSSAFSRSRIFGLLTATSTAPPESVASRMYGTVPARYSSSRRRAPRGGTRSGPRPAGSSPRPRCSVPAARCTACRSISARDPSETRADHPLRPGDPCTITAAQPTTRSSFGSPLKFS